MKGALRCPLARGFSLLEKLYAQSTFIAMGGPWLLVKRRKVHPFGKLEKYVFYAIFLLIPTYPIYWLLSNWPLLAGFLSMAVLWYAGQFLYFCRRCRTFACPFNRAAASYRVSAA